MRYDLLKTIALAAMIETVQLRDNSVQVVSNDVPRDGQRDCLQCGMSFVGSKSFCSSACCNGYRAQKKGNK